jgi:hypothetical protein
MEIGPVRKDKSVPDETVFSPRNERGEAGKEESEKDQLKISEVARRLQAESVQKEYRADAARREKLKAVQKRVENGFYDRPEIKEKIADRLINSEEMAEAPAKEKNEITLRMSRNKENYPLNNEDFLNGQGQSETPEGTSGLI